MPRVDRRQPQPPAFHLFAFSPDDGPGDAEDAAHNKSSACPGPRSRSGQQGSDRPAGVPEATPKAGEAVLAAIGRARRWVDNLMAGSSVAEIAKRENKGERHVRLLMPLAFVPPAKVRQFIEEGASSTASELARRVSVMWG